ncbi:MAG: GGDEF domain-containing protein [Betaproteobacteria bacterium]|nr:GGDEF domain-containing protein [Betaproteobacteria bacterium]
MCSLLTAHCSLLTAHCSLLTAHCSLLTAHCSLLTAHCLAAVHDVIGRYGGEEFLVMLPQTDLEGAKEVAERMCATIRATPYRVGTKSVTATVSIGVAASGGRAEEMFDAIRRADMVLYKAKNAGRDQVAWA